MQETSLAVRLDRPALTGDEVQRMAVGILNYVGILDDGLWPEFATHIEIVPNPNDDCLPTFNIRMCENAEDEAQVERLKALTSDFSGGIGPNGVLHFELRRNQ